MGEALSELVVNGTVYGKRLSLRLSVQYFFFSSRRRHTRSDRDWSSDVCSSDLDRLEEKIKFTGKPANLNAKIQRSAPPVKCAWPRIFHFRLAAIFAGLSVGPSQDRKSVV